ncbi:TPA: STM2901 family protein, partial [Klebsiella aerogenes]
FLDTAAIHFGVDNIMTIALIMLGQPIKNTRTKPGGATKGTSILSHELRKVFHNDLKVRLPTLTNQSIRNLRWSYVTNLGAFVGRWIPILGIIYLTGDVIYVSIKATTKYNSIARGDDKLW